MPFVGSAQRLAVVKKVGEWYDKQQSVPAKRQLAPLSLEEVRGLLQVQQKKWQAEFGIADRNFLFQTLEGVHEVRQVISTPTDSGKAPRLHSSIVSLRMRMRQVRGLRRVLSKPQNTAQLTKKV